MSNFYISDPSKSINWFVRETTLAAATLSEIRQMNVTPDKVREALLHAYGIEEQVDLLPLKLTHQDILERLQSFDFDSLEPLTEIEFDTSIIPPDIPTLLVEAEVKHKNEIWRIYKTDADPFPSNPHAHETQTGYKLHLGNGGLYKRRDLIGKIRNKDLLAIREAVTRRVHGIILPPL